MNALVQEMKTREAAFERRVPERHWIVIRLDGRGFSGMTEHMYEKPFDIRFHEIMCHVGEILLTEMQGAYLYTGSDEFSLLLSPTWAMFDRRLEKIVSLSASIASVAFTRASGHLAQFDSRLLAFDEEESVRGYFQWRQADVERCAINTHAYWSLRHTGMSKRQATRLLDGVPTEKKMDLLRAHGLTPDDMTDWQRRGVGMYWVHCERQGYNPILERVEVAVRRRIRVVEGHRTFPEWIATEERNSTHVSPTYSVGISNSIDKWNLRARQGQENHL